MHPLLVAALLGCPSKDPPPPPEPTGDTGDTGTPTGSTGDTGTPPTPEGAFHGRVVDVFTGDLVPGATVRADDAVATAADGTFVLDSDQALPTVEVSAPGHFDAVGVLRLEVDNVLALAPEGATVTADGGATDVADHDVGLSFPAGAVPSGTVLGLTGLGSAEVAAFPGYPDFSESATAWVEITDVAQVTSTAATSAPGELELPLPADTATADLALFRWDGATWSELPGAPTVSGGRVRWSVELVASAGTRGPSFVTTYGQGRRRKDPSGWRVIGATGDAAKIVVVVNQGVSTDTVVPLVVGEHLPRDSNVVAPTGDAVLSGVDGLTFVLEPNTTAWLSTAVHVDPYRQHVVRGTFYPDPRHPPQLADAQRIEVPGWSLVPHAAAFTFHQASCYHEEKSWDGVRIPVTVGDLDVESTAEPPVVPRQVVSTGKTFENCPECLDACDAAFAWNLTGTLVTDAPLLDPEFLGCSMDMLTTLEWGEEMPCSGDPHCVWAWRANGVSVMTSPICPQMCSGGDCPDPLRNSVSTVLEFRNAPDVYDHNLLGIPTGISVIGGVIPASTTLPGSFVLDARTDNVMAIDADVHVTGTVTIGP